MDNNYFKITGYVGKNVYRKQGDKWALTNFLVRVYKGKGKQSGKSEYDSIPVTCWYECQVASGDLVTVCGRLIMSPRSKGSKEYEIRLQADERGGVTFAQKDGARSYSVSDDGNQSDSGFYENAESSLSDDDFPPF